MLAYSLLPKLCSFDTHLSARFELYVRIEARSRRFCEQGGDLVTSCNAFLPLTNNNKGHYGDNIAQDEPNFVKSSGNTSACNTCLWQKVQIIRVSVKKTDVPGEEVGYTWHLIGLELPHFTVEHNIDPTLVELQIHDREHARLSKKVSVLPMHF